ADAIGMLHAEGVQDRPAAGVANENRLPHSQGGDHTENVVSTPLWVVPGRGVIGCAHAASCYRIDVKLVGELGGDVVVDVSGQVAPDKQHRPSRTAPVEHFQP